MVVAGLTSQRRRLLRSVGAASVSRRAACCPSAGARPAATPILDTLHQQLQDEPVSIILTDHAGVVLDRRTTSHDLTDRLDAVSLAPGYSYAEEFAGTNGIGTAISSGQQALVDGREHYTHQLGQLCRSPDSPSHSADGHRHSRPDLVGCCSGASKMSRTCSFIITTSLLIASTGPPDC
jgi:hypothetical protein